MKSSIKGIHLGIMLISLSFLFIVQPVNAVSVGISPGRIELADVLKGGYSERIITVSTGSDEEVIISMHPRGEIESWIKIEPADSTFTVSKNNPARLKVIVMPPDDTRIGNYTGELEFIAEGIADIPGRAGAVIKTAVTMRIKVEVTGNEIIKCRAGAIQIKDAEKGFPIEIQATVINDGNVRLKPSLTVDLWDKFQDNILLTREIVLDEIFPTTEKKMIAFLDNVLNEDQYWANLIIDECDAGSFQTFSIAEKGSIIDKGALVSVTNEPWYYTNETILIKALFKNDGQRSVSAKFAGVIKLDDKIVKVIETDELIVPSGQTADFDIFYKPEMAGRYTLTGKVLYNKKVTFEKGTVFNVNPAPEAEEVKKSMTLPLVIYVSITLVIIFLLRKIIREKRKRF